MFEQIAGWFIWGVAAIGYVGVLVLTERSAGRYMKNPQASPSRATVHVIVARPSAGVSAPAETRKPSTRRVAVHC